MTPTFEDFWNLYDKKRGRKKCIQKWNRLKDPDKLLIMEHVPEYVKSTPEVQWRKDPSTYLNGECWHDEIINYQKAKTIEVHEPMTITERIIYGTVSGNQ